MGFGYMGFERIIGDRARIDQQFTGRWAAQYKERELVMDVPNDD